MYRLAVIVATSALMLGCSNEERSPGNLLVESTRSSWDAPYSVPDNTPEGIRLGAILIEGDGPLGDVGLRVEISHRNTADIGIWLCYDIDNDGSDDVRVPVEIHRGKKYGWDEQELHACPQQLNGNYYFSRSPTEGSPFAALRGIAAGGTFSLIVADSLATETGVVHGWSLHQF